MRVHREPHQILGELADRGTSVPNLVQEAQLGYDVNIAFGDSSPERVQTVTDMLVAREVARISLGLDLLFARPAEPPGQLIQGIRPACIPISDVRCTSSVPIRNSGVAREVRRAIRCCANGSFWDIIASTGLTAIRRIAAREHSGAGSRLAAWAEDFIELTFQGGESRVLDIGGPDGNCVVDAECQKAHDGPNRQQDCVTGREPSKRV